MKRLKFFSLMMAVLICLPLCLAACNGANVGKHDHVWDNGEITTQPTCYKEGVKTFHCTVDGCEQTKTIPVQVTPHKWDDGTQTKAPKCDEVGETTFRCTNSGCTAIKTEPIAKMDHEWDQGVITTLSDFDSKGQRTFTCQNCQTTRVEVLDAYADFVEQFGSKSWSYGVATDFDGATCNFTLASNGQTAVTANSVTIEGAVAVGYTFGQGLPEKCQAAFTVKFEGSVLAYIVVKAANGSVKSHKQLNTQSGAVDFVADVGDDAIDVQKDDTLYLVLSGNAQGALGFRLYAPCLHVWNSSITEAPTCTDTGTKTFTCVNDGCEESFTEEMAATGHKWDGGTVTEDATEDKDGVRTYTCQVCGETKTESIPKLPSDYIELANFGADFNDTLAGDSNWQVGKIDYTWGDNENFTFAALTEKTTDAFTCGDPKMEVKGDWMINNGMVGLAYTFDQATDVRFVFTLSALYESKFSVRWALKNIDGTIKTNDGKPSWGGDSDPFSMRNDIAVEAGDVLYVLVNKETGEQCNFTFSIKTRKPEPQTSTAVFANDFDDTLAGNSAWQVGIADYTWDGGENFTFRPIEQTENGAFVNADPQMEIRRDTLSFRGMVALGYRFDTATAFGFRFVLTGDKDGDFAVRWSLNASDGTIKSGDGHPTWGDRNCNVELSAEGTAEAGDVLYVLINQEASASCHFTFEVTAETEPTEPEWNEPSGFADDFQATLDGTSKWSVGTVEYIWTQENFVFTEDLTVKDGAFTKEEPWVEIKGDWMAINTMVGIAYTFDVAGTEHFELHLRGKEADSAFTIRWALKNADGTIKTNDGKASFVGNDRELRASQDLEVEANDVLYILIQKETDRDQCNFAITVNAVDKEIANFGADFNDTFAGTSNWTVGIADYKFDGIETFTVTPLTDKTSDAFTHGDPKMEIKGDWMINNGMVALGYRFDQAADVRFVFTLSVLFESKFSVRWALTNSDGTIKTNNGKASWGGDSNPFSMQNDLTVEAGDVLYVLVNKELGEQCNFTFTISSVQ